MVAASKVTRRLGAAYITLAAFATLPAPQAAGADGVPERALGQRPADVRGYWTPRRMASARPGWELLAGVPLAHDPVPGERGKPTSVPATRPASRAGLVDDLLDGLVAGPDSARAPARRVANPRRRPLRTHGKVFFRLPSGDFFCSGTAVRARSKRLVVTAGHCVFGDGQFATNWMFVPGKDGASEPFGRWTAKTLATTPRWRAAEDVRFDVGMATMHRRGGKALQRVVGARGIAFNKGRKRRFKVFGYPALGRFDGTHLERCVSRGQGTDPNVPPPSPTRIDCDMTGGASGGGWVIRRGRVNSVISYGYEALCPVPVICPNPEAGKLFGPYFGNSIKRLYRVQRKPPWRR